jgi:hypothetical protein
MSLKKIIAGFVIALSLLGFATKGAAEPLPIPKLTADQYIKDIFGDKAQIAKAVIFHESNNKLDAKNYNCIYNGKSTFCKKEDRSKAWSVDCGIAQINVKGQVCPPELLTLQGNMKAVEKVYKEQGFNAWVSYKTGAYKRFL